MVAANNRWTTPYLDDYAVRIRGDINLKVAINKLKAKFMILGEALLHGDLHTGSIMVTPEDTRVIDPEFSFYGPMAFDVGKILAELLINYFSQSGHEETPGARDPYRKWILATVEQVWVKFAEKFIALWNDPALATGDLYLSEHFADDPGKGRLKVEQDNYMARLWSDSLQFAGAFFIRRILGIAHDIDFEQIKDERLRATCEARALEMAIELMLKSDDIFEITDLIKLAQKHDASEPVLNEPS